MTHFDEMTCLQFLDGQLEAGKAAELEQHTRACASCGALLEALRRETALLHHALVEDDESVPAWLLTPQRRERVPWGWIVSLGFASLGAFTLWDQIVQPLLANLSEAGFGGGNLLAMLFFSGVFWKGWSEMTLLWQTFAAATLGAPLVFLLLRKWRHMKPVTLALCALAGLLALPAPVHAAEVIKGQQSYTLPAGETLANDLIVMGARVKIEGTVDGDLYVFCQSASISGRVTGDVIAFTQGLEVDGQVDGDIRAFANSMTIKGTVARSVTTFLERFTLDSSGSIGHGIIAFGKSADFDGRVGRDVLLFADRTDLTGFVGGNFQMGGGDLNITSSAEIQGKAKYRGHKEPTVAEGARLASPLEKEIPRRRQSWTDPRFYWWQAVKWGVGFIFGLVAILLLPAFFRETVRSTRRYGPAVGFGLVSLIGVPILAVIAMITIVGLAVGIGGMLLWIIALYSCKVVVGTWLGQLVMGRVNDTWPLVGRLAVGTFLLRILANLPYVGGFVVFAYVVLGMGAITLAVYDRIKAAPAAAVPSAAPAV